MIQHLIRTCSDTDISWVNDFSPHDISSHNTISLHPGPNHNPNPNLNCSPTVTLTLILTLNEREVKCREVNCLVPDIITFTRQV